MPTSVIATVVGAVVADAVTVAAGSALVGAIAGGLAASATGMLLSGGREKGQASFHTSAASQQRNVSVRSSVSPWDVVYGKVRKGGTFTYFEGSADNSSLYMVITLAGHQVNAIGDIYFNDEIVPIDGSGNATGKYAGYAYVEKNLGSPGQSAFAGLVAESAGKWTNDHRQQGRAGLYVKLVWNQDLFPNGLPNITAEVEGKIVWDPRLGSSTYSTNAALCLADYLIYAQGLGVDYTTEIDETQLITAANICDENVTLKAGGTEKRYTCNGVATLAATPEQTIKTMLTCMAGLAVYIAGKWRIVPGYYRAPTVTLDESTLRGPITIQPRRSRRDLFNAVKGVYISPENNWQSSDFPPYISSTYYAEDQNERIWDDIELPFTTSGATAQRIAKQRLETNRRQMEIVYPCKLHAYQVIPSDTVMITNSRMGWSAKVFEVMSTRLIFDGGELGVDLVLRETDSSVYTWTAASDETTVTAAPTTNLPNPFTTGAPGAPTISEEIYETTGSAGVKTRLNVTWNEPTDQFAASGGLYQLEYKESSSGTWIVLPNIKAPSYSIDDAQVGSFDFRVKTLNTFGVSSPYSPTTTHAVIGLNELPAIVNSFAVRPTNGLANFAWARHDDLDVRIGGFIEIRHTPTTSAAGVSWADSSLIERFNGNTVSGVGPLILGHYVARARDSVGNYSSGNAIFLADDALITGYTTVASVVEATSFPGSKVTVTATNGILQLTNPSSYLTGTYFFPVAGYIDCGSQRTRRYESDITLTRFDQGDLIDSRGNVDSWPNIDGGNVDKGDVYLYAQTTSTDPASASSVWTEYTPFRVADFNARGARFKLVFESDSPTHNLGVTELNVHIKVPS